MATAKPNIITFKQLLSMAHGKANEIGAALSIETEALRVADDGTFAFFRAVVTMTQGGEKQTFTGHADATKTNVGPAMQNCLPRMAETRAIVRPLRLAVNIGETAAEEMTDYQESAAGRSSGTRNAPTATLNDSGVQCPKCFAPDGANHLKTCSTLQKAAA